MKIYEVSLKIKKENETENRFLFSSNSDASNFYSLIMKELMTLKEENGDNLRILKLEPSEIQLSFSEDLKTFYYILKKSELNVYNSILDVDKQACKLSEIINNATTNK